MPDLKMLNSTKYLYKLTFIKCSYGWLQSMTKPKSLVGVIIIIPITDLG